MRFVDRVVRTDYAGNGAVEATITAGKPYLSASGVFAEHWLIEIMAQAVGCIFALQDRTPEEALTKMRPKIGYLVAIDDFQFFPGDRLAVGSILSIDVNLIHAFYPIGQYRAAVCVQGVEVANGIMKFMTDDERSLPFDAF
jgi:3-hydroxymyristoyl/3-hydroxydecanoyl-(acyl carrier protein) dehydratase